jgi:hypothetical protein
MVAELECFSGPTSYTGDSIATGRASHAKQIGGKKTKKQPIVSPELLEVECRDDNPTS